MPVTLTIKQVPERVAVALRKRAERNHRSLQRELMAILEQIAHQEDLLRQTAPARVAEPTAAYGKASTKSRKPSSEEPYRVISRGGTLTLQELWERAKALGESEYNESTADIRRDRDER
jgi:plasmid stability protein